MRCRGGPRPGRGGAHLVLVHASATPRCGLLVLAYRRSFIVANDVAVGRTFFNLPLMRDSFWLVLQGLLDQRLHLRRRRGPGARLGPGRRHRAPAAGHARPSRSAFLATAYADVFRGLPAIITIYLVAFGLALAGLPIVRDLPLSALAIFALTLTYGAYVARGLSRRHREHPLEPDGGGALARPLLSCRRMRFVVVPQAVRRIIPPLLNDFIGLQKDTALVQVVGIIDAFNQSKIIASNKFNLSAVTIVGILFVLFTIPQARFVDRLLEREKRRTQAGG